MSIESQLRKWMDDPSNAKRIQKARADKIRNSGLNGEMKSAMKYAEELRQNLHSFLPMYEGKSEELRGQGGLQASIDINDILISEPTVLPSGEIEIQISFDKSKLVRQSLQPADYPDVDDIISLLVHGYSTGGDVFGRWHGHEQWNLRDRPANPFIENAVNWFNDNHVGVAEAVIVNDRYKV